MSLNKSADKLVVAVISEGEFELIWLQGMLEILNLDIEVIVHQHIKEFKLNLSQKKFNLVIASNAFYKKLSTLLLNSSSIDYPPLLIISQEKENFSNTSNDKLTVDFIPSRLSDYPSLIC
jgi:hypothetical protein